MQNLCHVLFYFYLYERTAPAKNATILGDIEKFEMLTNKNSRLFVDITLSLRSILLCLRCIANIVYVKKKRGKRVGAGNGRVIARYITW